MAPDKIKLLLESYYSGDISPEDYETLLSEMKEAKGLPPELEIECRILLSVDSYEPPLPEGLEKMLSKAIDSRYRKAHNRLRILFSAAAAAVVLICMTIGMLDFGNKGLPDSEYIAENTIRQKDVSGTALQIAGTAEENEITTESVETESAEEKVYSESKEESVIPEIDVEELDKATRIVDESLLNVLSMIHIAQNEITESLENIQITQRTNLKN